MTPNPKKKKRSLYQTRKRGGRPPQVSNAPKITGLADHLGHPSVIPPGMMTNLLVSWDIGTSYLKVSYTFLRGRDQSPPRLLRDRYLMSSIQTIVWPHNTTECPTQMAFVKAPSGEIRQLWGHEVEDALEGHEIQEKDCLRWLKPSMYHDTGSTAFHHDRLLKRLDDLKKAGIEAKVLYPNNPDVSPSGGKPRKIEAEDVWLFFHQHAWAYVVKEIKAAHPDVRWPPRKQTHTSLDQSPYKYTRVEVALPMPAGSTPQQVQMALNTARKAGIPNVYPVAEPAAAAAYAAQADFEKNNAFIYQGTTLICDHGGGTVDIILCSVERSQSSPENSEDLYFELREEVAGVQRWCGAAFQNERFRNLFLAEHDMACIVDQMRYQGIETTEEEFMEDLERNFDKKKISFTGETLVGCRQMVLQAKGVPRVDTTHFRMGNNVVTIKGSGVQMIFEPPLKSVINLINSQISAFHIQNCGPDGKLQKRVERILLVGGGNQNHYIRNAIVEKCGNVRLNPSDVAPLYQIEVSTLPRNNSSSLATVNGALLLLMDKPFVGERVARRGFCFTWDPIARRNVRYEEGRTYHDPASRCCRVMDSAEFFIKRGQRIRNGHQDKKCRGSRTLYLSQLTENRWEIRETLWYTDHECEDDAWVTSPQSRFGKAGEIQFYLDEKDAEGFPSGVDCDGNPYKETQYEMAVIINGSDMEYTLRIPRSGRFDKGRQCIERVGRLDCQAMYQLYNPASST